MEANEKVVRWAMKQANFRPKKPVDYEKSKVEFTLIAGGYCVTCWYETEGMELRVRYKDGNSEYTEFEYYDNLTTMFNEISEVG